jgi:sugar (pentulose or hexulose) kinase
VTVGEQHTWRWPTSVVIGVDIGTTSIKAVAHDPEGGALEARSATR